MMMSEIYGGRYQFQFTREEIAAELKRCGYPLASNEDIERFERDLAALYSEGNFVDAGSALGNDESNFSDKFYDLPPPTRDDIDFSKYYTRQENIKSTTSDCIRSSGDKSTGRFPMNLIKDPPKLQPISCRSVPSSARSIEDKIGHNISNASSVSTTKRKVLRRSDDGSAYIDELLYGRTLPTIKQSLAKKNQLPLVEDDGIGDDAFPPLSVAYNCGLADQLPLEDKISRLTLVSEGSAANSPASLRRSADVVRKTSSRGGQSPLGLSDRDNRQGSSGKSNTRQMTDSAIAGLTSVIRPPPPSKGKRVGLTVAQDPVTRYAEYAKAWRNQRAPGEKAHKELRWQIRGQMLARDETVASAGRRTLASNTTVSSQRPISGPNNYVVPTEKKRQALRWSIRCALAAGRQPPPSTRYVNRAFFSG